MTGRRRAARRLVPAVLLALLATGCSSETEPRDSVGDAAERGAEAAGLPEAVDYVALGDSYTAGPFIGTMRVDPEGCGRSAQNYPAFLADWLDVATYTDVSCSAATTADLVEDQLLFNGRSTAPQLDAVTADTDLVTLGMGGNDFGIYSSLVGCQQPSGGCEQERLLRDAGRVAGRVEQAVRRIVRRAPEADVYVVGYPQILPPGRPCPEVGIGAAALPVLDTIARRLNGSLRRGAEASGATYVDLETASQGHDVCAGEEAWVNGPAFRVGVAAPFHPLAEGMRGAAAEVYRAIAGEDAPDSDRATPDPDAVVLNDVP